MHINIILIIQWLVGFYLQVVPVAFICIYPLRNYFRFSARNFYILISLTIIITSILYVIAVAREYMYNGGLNSNYIGVSDAYFIASLAILMLVFLYSIKTQLSYKLFVFLIGMSYGFFIEITNRTINYFFPYLSQEGILYSIPDLIHYTILNAIFLLPMIKLMQILRESFSSNLNKKVWRVLTLILSGLLLFLIVFYELPYALDSNPLQTLYIFINALFLFILILYYWIFLVILEERKLFKRQTKWELLVKSYQLEERNLNEIRKLRHELRHHLSALQLYLKNKDYSGAQKYLEQISEIEDELPVQAFSADNLFNLVLSDYYQRIMKENIRADFDISVLNNLEMEDIDLIELFSNLLDNAIEANDKVENKYLKLFVRQNGTFLTIRCDNSFDVSKLKMNGQNLTSSKTNTLQEKHGFGTRIMKEIAEKYNGHIKFETDEDIFSVLINLSLIPEGERLISEES